MIVLKVGDLVYWNTAYYNNKRYCIITHITDNGYNRTNIWGYWSDYPDGRKIKGCTEQYVSSDKVCKVIPESTKRIPKWF